jgi:hypothetical protein
MFETTWRNVPDKVEIQHRRSGRVGKLEECMRCRIQVAYSMDMQPLRTRAGLQLELHVRRPIEVEHLDLAVRVLVREDLAV